MKLATYNINSVRVRLERLLRWLEEDAPDVVGLQETKATEDQFPLLEIQSVGYKVEVVGQKSYNGVAVLSKGENTNVVRRLPGDDSDQEARFLSVETSELRFITVYVPNGKEVGSPSYEMKLKWLARLLDHLKQDLDPGKPTVLCGDFNIAPHDSDVYDPSAWEGKNLCSIPERECFRQILDWGFVDVLKRHQPEVGVYSWWDYRMGMFWRNKGLRIDHVLLTHDLADRSSHAQVVREMRKGHKPSDHAPVMVTLD